MASIDAGAAPAAAPPPLSKAICLSFGIGTVGVSVMSNAVTVYFPALMSTVLGISPAIAGAMLMGSKIYDMFADVIIGGASDRHQSSRGRRRPFLLAGALTSFVSLLMIFLAPDMSGWVLLTYMGAALVIYSTGYSLFCVPYLAMPAEMTDGYQERTRLISFRTAFIGIGQLLSLAVTAALIQAGGGGADGFRLMGVVMAVLTLATMLISYAGTAGARMLERDERDRGLTWASLGTVFRNRPMMMLMGAKMSQYLAFGIMLPANLLFLLNVVKVGYVGMVHMSVAQNVAVFASMPLWVKLGRRLGKRDCYIIAVGLFLVPSALSWYWAAPGLPMWGIWVRSVVWGIGSGGALLMTTSMLPDATEYDRLTTGQRREGVFSSLYAVNEKVGFAIGAAILGFVLTASGYVATTGGRLVDQSASAIAALYAVKAFVPAALLTLGLALIWFYDLDEKRLKALAASNAARDRLDAAAV